jgi:hypothetical protein
MKHTEQSIFATLFVSDIDNRCICPIYEALAFARNCLGRGWVDGESHPGPCKIA